MTLILHARRPQRPWRRRRRRQNGTCSVLHRQTVSVSARTFPWARPRCVCVVLQSLCSFASDWVPSVYLSSALALLLPCSQRDMLPLWRSTCSTPSSLRCCCSRGHRTRSVLQRAARLRRCVCVCVHAHADYLRRLLSCRACMHTKVYARRHALIHTHAHGRACVTHHHTRLHACRCTCIRVCTHRYVYTHTGTCTHTLSLPRAHARTLSLTRTHPYARAYTRTPYLSAEAGARWRSSYGTRKTRGKEAGKQRHARVQPLGQRCVQNA